MKNTRFVTKPQKSGQGGCFAALAYLMIHSYGRDVEYALEWPSHKIIKERLDRKKKVLVLQHVDSILIFLQTFIVHVDCSETIRNNLHS